MPRTSTLIIPGLAAAPAAVDDQACPNLKALCRRSRVLRDPDARSRHDLVWAALGGATPAPGAAVSSWFALHGEVPDDPLLLVTPVQMIAGPEQASMVPVPDAGPEVQPGLWIRLTQAALEYGGRLIAGPEGLVWLKLAEDPGLGGTDPFLAAGGPVDLPDDQQLIKLLNHMQMVLHSESDAGFNSLWFWGGGPLPASRPDASGITLVSGDAVVRGMALACGATVVDRWRGQYPVISTELGLMTTTGALSWQDALATIDTEWFAQLLDAEQPVEIIDTDVGLRLAVVTSWWRRLLMRGGAPSDLLGWPRG